MVVRASPSVVVMIEIFSMGGCGIVSKSDRVIKVCVASVSIIAGTNELLIVTGTMMSDELIV